MSNISPELGAKATAATSHSSAPPKENLRDADLHRMQEVVETIILEKWSTAMGDAPPADAPASNWSATPAKHVVGGFSVVLRLPNQGVAFRLQAMDKLKSGLTWVAFHQMLLSFLASPRRGPLPAVLLTPDRSLVLPPPPPRGAPPPPPPLAWEDTPVARSFQAARLRAATVRLGRLRRRLLETSSAAWAEGECAGTGGCPVEDPAERPGELGWAGAGRLAGGVRDGLLFPTHWFWLRVG
jgi:hypothetical protein